MESKGGKKSLVYEAPLGYSIEHIQPARGIEKFKSAAYYNNLYKLGARKIGVTSLPPLGCLPAAITLFGDLGSSQCVPSLNKDVVAFNNKLNSTVIALQSFHGNYFMVNRDVVAFMENAQYALCAHSSSVKASGPVKVPNQNVPRM